MDTVEILSDEAREPAQASSALRILVVDDEPMVRALIARVLSDAGTISESSLICAYDWVTGTRTDNNADNDIAVANVSIAGPGTDDGACGSQSGDPMHAAICRSVEAGVTYVVAAGNGATDVAGVVPAAYDEVLTATAMTVNAAQAMLLYMNRTWNDLAASPTVMNAYSSGIASQAGRLRAS